MGNSENEKTAVALVLAAITVIALAIIISKKLFPFFLTTSIVALLVLIVSFIVESGIFSGDIFNSDFSLTPVIGIVFVVCVAGTLLTYVVGYGIGGTSIGKATVEVYQSITGAKQSVSDTLWQSMNDIVDVSCKELSEENCATLRTFAKTAKTVQEVSDLADKLKTAQRVARAVS